MPTPLKSALPLPRASLARIEPLPAHEVLAAWVADQPEGCCAGEAAAKALAGVLPYAESLDAAAGLGLLREDGGMLIARTERKGKTASVAATGRDALRALAVRALGGPAAPAGGKRGRDLPGLALRQLFGLDELPAWPSARQARCALLSRIATSFGGVFADCARQPLKSFTFDEMSRRIYLAFAGLQRGTVLQADAALLSNALDGPADNVQALTATVIRAAVAAVGAAGGACPAQAPDLENFARSVKKLASGLETKPYTGRVAIAQVYDTGLAQGLKLGTLDEFKENLAEAAREGLLDLERYDITGPLDAGLRERSRLRLGRDERHFIVNQWI